MIRRSLKTLVLMMMVVLIFLNVTNAAGEKDDELIMALEDILESNNDPFLNRPNDMNNPSRVRPNPNESNPTSRPTSIDQPTTPKTVDRTSTTSSSSSHPTESSKSHQNGKEREGEEVSREQLTLRKTDPVGSAAMFVVGLITTSLNFVSCGYLLYLVYTLSKRVGFHASLRLLAYSVVFDMLVGLFFTLSIVYSALFDVLITGVSCQAIGFVINLLTASDMLLMTFVAVSTYAKVIHHYELPRGKYDYILLLVVIGIPLLASGILANFHAFGPESLWCYIDDDSTAGRISTAGLVALYLLTGLVVGSCYILIRRNSQNQPEKYSLTGVAGHSHSTLDNTLTHTISNNTNTLNNAPSYTSIGTIKVSKDQHPSYADNGFAGRWKVEEMDTGLTKNTYHYHRKSILTMSYAEVKLETHLLIHFFQYTPPCVHLIAMFCGYRTPWVFTLAILSTNLGGLFQLWAYLHHQKKKRAHLQQQYPSRNNRSPPLPEKALSLLYSSQAKPRSSLPPRFSASNSGPLRNSSYQLDPQPSVTQPRPRPSTIFHHHNPSQLSAISSNSSHLTDPILSSADYPALSLTTLSSRPHYHYA